MIGVFVYNIELTRQLCQEIHDAQGDCQKEEALLSLLQAIIREDHEEIRTRMAFLLKKYGTEVNSEVLL